MTTNLRARAVAAYEDDLLEKQRIECEKGKIERLRRRSALRAFLEVKLGVECDPQDDHIEIDGIRFFTDPSGFVLQAELDCPLCGTPWVSQVQTLIDLGRLLLNDCPECCARQEDSQCDGLLAPREDDYYAKH